jgi:fermentation-respiration switch protein FrsA (DUF1100 family)
MVQVKLSALSKWNDIMAVLGVVFIGASLLFWFNQNDYIYEPMIALQTTPERVGLQAEDIRITSGTGSERGELFSWWLPSNSPKAPTLLYLHGNDKNIGQARDLEYVRSMHGMGYNVLMIDYRGYGNSTGGVPNESKLYEDAESAWNYLVKQRGILPSQLFIYGHSLGGAIAIDLAMHHPEAAGIIEESSFTNMPAVVNTTEFGFMPTNILIHQRFDSIAKVPKLKIPLLIIHGTWDKTVPYQMGQKLYEAAVEPKSIVLIKGGMHENSCIAGRVECEQAFTTFVTKRLH